MPSRFQTGQCVAAAILMALTGCAGTSNQVKIIDPSDKSMLSRFSKDDGPKVQYEETLPEEVPEKLKDPDKLSLLYARLMEDANNLSEAERHYQEVLDRNPDHIIALVGLGRIQMASRMPSQAEDHFRHALRIAPDSPVALRGMGQFYAQSNRWDDAVEMLNKATLANPTDRESRHDLAVALVRTGDIDSALPHFIRTVGDAEAHYNVGLILKDMGQIEECRQQMELAVAKKPSLQQANYWLRALENGQGVSPSVSHSEQSGLKPSGHASGLAMTRPLEQ